MKASGPISDIGCDIRRFLSAMVSTPSGAWPLPHPRSRRACNSQPALRLVDAGDAEDEDCIGTAALQHKGAPSTADRCKLQSVLGLQPALTRFLSDPIIIRVPFFLLFSFKKGTIPFFGQKGTTQEPSSALGSRAGSMHSPSIVAQLRAPPTDMRYVLLGVQKARTRLLYGPCQDNFSWKRPRPAIGLPSRSGCCSGTNGGRQARLQSSPQHVYG